MINKYTISLALIILIGLGGYFYGVDVTNTKWKAKTEEAINEAVQAALSKERALQHEVNKIAQRQADELHGINERLTSELDSLRNRPSRRDVSRDTGADCQGANGPELAREYAEFLTRYGAKAAKQDAELAACYAYADSIQER